MCIKIFFSVSDLWFHHKTSLARSDNQIRLALKKIPSERGAGLSRELAAFLLAILSTTQTSAESFCRAIAANDPLAASR